MKRYSYDTDEEMESILIDANQKGYVLKEVGNWDGENYLLFDVDYERKIRLLESALLEYTTFLAVEQFKNLQNEQAILELTLMLGGV